MSDNPTHPIVDTSNGRPSGRPVMLIGELINNSFSRARRAWSARDITGFQRLAKLQQDLGADYLTVNLDGTQSLMVRPNEMIDFIPDLIPALQEVASLPLAFDNPWVDYHQRCLEVYDASQGGPPIVNSVSASREHLEEMFQLIAQYDTRVIVMASEKFVNGGSTQCFSPHDVHRTAKDFVEMLHEKSGRENEHIIIDPGLAPISADTYGLVNMGIDAMRLIRADSDLADVNISVGLTNFSFGVPKHIREGLENAYITIAVESGLDCVLGNPEKQLGLLDESDQFLQIVRQALAEGCPADGESQEEAGFRQSARIMDLYR